MDLNAIYTDSDDDKTKWPEPPNINNVKDDDAGVIDSKNYDFDDQEVEIIVTFQQW